MLIILSNYFVAMRLGNQHHINYEFFYHTIYMHHVLCSYLVERRNYQQYKPCNYLNSCILHINVPLRSKLHLSPESHKTNVVNSSESRYTRPLITGATSFLLCMYKWTNATSEMTLRIGCYKMSLIILQSFICIFQHFSNYFLNRAM